MASLRMMQLSTLPLKIFFFVTLIALLALGVYLARNHEQLFGRQSPGRAETSGERFYTKTQIFVCWLLSVKLVITLLWLL